MEVSDGDVAGLENQRRFVSGEYAFRLVAHRNRYSSLVRKKVHSTPITVVIHHLRVSFIPEIDDIDIEINPADLRIDVYRASGAVVSTSIKLKVRCVLLTCQVELSCKCQNDRSPTQK